MICVARRPMQPTYPHDTISGVETLLAGVVRSDGPALTEYQWDFGDSAKSRRTALADPDALEAKHVYTGPVGRVFRATLTVWDQTGASHSDDYYVRIRPDTPRTRAQMACDAALWNLHKRMQPFEQDGVPIGYWDNPGGNHRLAITAASLQAFENLGNFPFDDDAESPYVEDVRLALNQVLLDMKAVAISRQNAGDPDLNGNEVGLYSHHEQSLKHVFSSQGIAIMSLVMSRDPQRVAAVGGPHVLGRKLVDIVQDMIDYVAFGQTDVSPEEIVTRGGWRYDGANSGDADMVCTQYPVYGLMMAEQKWGRFGLSVPAWVKTELRDNFLPAARDPATGGWFYVATPTSHVNVALTGMGVASSACTGISVTDPMVQSGLAYIADEWDSPGQFGHLSSMFSMYAVCNGMRFYGISHIGQHDWYKEYAEHLLNSQNPDGSWSSEGYEQSWPLTTAWAVLILLEPQAPPSVIIEKPQSAQQDIVTMHYRLSDDNSDECDLTVEFSIDDGKTWNTATQVGGDTLTNIEAPPEGISRQFLWDTVADIGKVNADDVRFRITATDGEKGNPAIVVIPGVYNDVAPFERIELNAPSANSRGVAFADYDNDGDFDVFIANFGQDNFLFRNDSGTSVETARAAGMSGRLPSNCGVWGDFNNDGAIDLYLVLADQRNKLYAGDGTGYFTEMASRVGADNGGGGISASWGDYDSDGWLDLYIANDPAFGFGFNALYRNLGVDGLVNLAGKLKVNSPVPTRAACWGDFDRDGSLDLFIANGGATPEERADSLFRNVSGSFLDAAVGAGVADVGDGSAAVFADLNGDRFPDLFLVNTSSRSIVLYLNNGDGTFRDATYQAGLEGLPDARGAAVADFDNDGDLDVFVSAKGRDSLYLNKGNCTFADVASLTGVTDLADSRGAAWADVNGDGFLDLCVAISGSKSCLYLNKRADGNWLRVRCLTDADGDATDTNSSDDRDAIGAIVEVDVNGDMNFSSQPPDRLEVQCVDGGSGYMSQGQLWPHFGLGRYRSADVRVTFPDGSVVYRSSIAANQTLIIRDIAPRGEFYVQVFTPEVPVAGQVPIGYVIFNSSEKYCRVLGEYSLDGGKTWLPATPGRGGDGTANLLSSPLGVFHRYVWDSVRNLGQSNYDSVRIRVTPFDPYPGPPAETSDFSVYNNTPPSVSVETPFGVSTGEVLVRYTLTDVQSDKCVIGAEYSTDGGASWHGATRGTTGDGTANLSSSPEGVPHTYAWNSFADVGHVIRDNLTIRLTPFDPQPGAPDETAPFAVDNNLPPSAAVETPAAVQKADVALKYRLLDAESDSCSVAIAYSLDGGRSWQPASMASGSEGTAALKSSRFGEPHSYVWDSFHDLGSSYSSAARMIVVPQDRRPGASAQTGDFVVDNLRPPELAFSPDAFFFSATQGAEPPALQTLEIWNRGSHSLEWSAASDAGWAIVHPDAGLTSGEKNTVQVSVDITALSAGMYSGTITLSAPGATGSPATIPVVLEIFPPPPSLNVSEVLLSFHAKEGGADPPPQLIHIRNTGGGDMPWQAQADQTWISLSPLLGSSTGETDAVEVRVSAAGLPVGSHSGAVVISAPNAANSPHTVTVSLDIEPAIPELTVSPNELAFVTRRGGPNPPDQELRLRFSGGSGVAWKVENVPPWLSLTPSSGVNSGEETVIRVAVYKTRLDIGTYTAEVTFSAVGLPVAPQKVVVTLEIRPILVPDDFPSIQEAVNHAEYRDLVRVKPGVYVENVVMKDGVDVIGAGALATTIRADRVSSVVLFQNILSARLEGFTITGGSGDFYGRESRFGGGIYFANSTAVISGCNISGNSASWGGGVCVDKGSIVTLLDCSIFQNSAASGAGIFCYEGYNAVVERCRVFENSASQFGAGVFAHSGGILAIRSCEVFRNSAERGGDGIYGWTGALLEVVSCTIADNSGEGVVADPGAAISIFNSILWSNSLDLDIPSGQTVQYCDIATGDFAGNEGNISDDPLFLAPTEDCYDLLPNSPCIDAGLNSAPGLPTADIHGEPRIMAVRGSLLTDIGADEHNPAAIFLLIDILPQPGLEGEVLIGFSVLNALSLSASVVAEFSVGGAAWRPATRADGERMTDLSSSPTGVRHSFVWDSVPDLKGETGKTVRYRLRLYEEDARPGATTAPFSVDNTLSDSDSDGLPDAWEEAVAAADPDDNITSIADVDPEGDPDADGSDNLREYLARTDPLDPGSEFRATCLPGESGTMVISWQSAPGRYYQVFKCDRMGEKWVSLGPRLPGAGQTLSVVDATVPQGPTQRYYTVSVE